MDKVIYRIEIEVDPDWHQDVPDAAKVLIDKIQTSIGNRGKVVVCEVINGK